MAYGSVLTDTVQSSTAGTPPTFKDGNSVQIGTLCRAWVYFNGSGTVAIVGSFNVSSITDNGTGDYTVNFTTAMPDANYSCIASTDPTAGSVNIAAGPTVFATGSVRVATENSTGAASDRPIVTVAVFR